MTMNVINATQSIWDHEQEFHGQSQYVKKGTAVEALRLPTPRTALYGEVKVTAVAIAGVL
jgi:hypothetical protein